jgi:hypothetical protein
MAVAWVQENESCDGFPSSHLDQLNSLKRNTLETAFSFFKLPLKFSDQRRKLKTRVPEETGGKPPPVHLGRSDRACLGLRVGAVQFSACPFYFAFSAHEKKMAR